MPSIYEQLGVTPIINASGTRTRLGGTIMPTEVVEAMVSASRNLVELEDLQAAGSRIISEVTGAEAGIVTNGAAAGLTLATAACVTGLDISKMERLPDTAGMKNEVVITRNQRNPYDHAVRAVGVTIIEAGLDEQGADVGVRSVEGWEVEAAMDENTAAVIYFSRPGSTPALEEVVRAAKSKTVPVIVDAADRLPPASNLRHFISQGASLVVFSGGKAIRGPQSSGILCGRQDLIMSAALQLLDMDVAPQNWDPPRSLIDKSRLKGQPRHGLGRGFKVGKEEIVGLLTALRRYSEGGHERDMTEWEKNAKVVANGLRSSERMTVDYIPPSNASPYPTVELRFGGSVSSSSALELMKGLQGGDPPIYLNDYRISEGVLTINPINLDEERAQILIGKILTLVTSPENS